MATPKKATTRVTAAALPVPPATREELEIAQHVAQSTAPAPTVVRMQITLSPEAQKKLDRAVFDLSQIGVRASASAIIEASMLDAVDRGPAALAMLVQNHFGQNAARRRPT